MTQNDNSEETLKQLIDADFSHTVAELSNLVRIPSVSFEGFDKAEVLRSAEAVAKLLESTGVFDEVEILTAEISEDETGNPAVVASRKAKNGKKTVLLYAHHDVQPEGNPADWETEPFQPTLKNGRLYGRGSSDDKSGIIVHYASLKAVAELLAADLDLGVVVFVEGEEESGSRSFANFLEKYRQKLAADVIIVADSSNPSLETPGITVALRGAVAFKLRIRTLDRASHSGMFGGAVPDAPLAMFKLISTFWDADGSVAVEGLKDRKAKVAEYSEAELRTETGLLDRAKPIGSGEILNRIWNKPAITITGIDITNVKNSSNTLIPEVQLKISARVAPGQSAEEAYQSIKKHIEKHNSYGAELEFYALELGEAVLVDTDKEAFSSYKTALKDSFQHEAEEIGVGGSIPFIADLARVFPEAQILITGVEDPDSRAHSPNESQDLELLRKVITAQALFLLRLNS